MSDEILLSRWDVWALVELGEGEHSVEEVRARAASMRRSWWNRLYYRLKHDPLFLFRPFSSWK